MPGPTTASTGSSFVVPQFDEQVFLMYNLCYFSKEHFTDHTKFHQPYTKVRMLKGQNTALINTLINKDYPKKEPILNLTQPQISQLVPSIRLYKQYYAPGSMELENEIEFIFPNYASENNNTILGDGRGEYGLLSFDIESQGTTFYTADKQFTAKIKLFFQSFDQITQVRTATNNNGTKESYRILDLIVQPFPPGQDPDKRDTATTSDPSQFRIRVDVGWSAPGNSTLTSEQLQAVKLTKTSFFLYLTDHDIEINQDGTVNLTISYIGAFDFINRDVRAGIILNKGNKADYDLLTKAVKDASTPDSNGNVNNQNVEKARGDLNTFIANVGPSSYQEIIEELFNPTEPDTDGVFRSKIYQMAISPGAKDQFCFIAGGDVNNTEWLKAINKRIAAARPTTQALNGLAGQMYDFLTRNVRRPKPINFCSPTGIFSFFSYGAGATVDDPKRYFIDPVKLNIETALPSDAFRDNPILVDELGNEYTNISWFYLGDMLEILMKRAYDETVTEKDSKLLLSRFGSDFSKRIKLILSDIQYRSTCYKQTNRVNLAHIPVSVKKFQIFFYNKVITTRNLHYTMDDFIRDFINVFMKDVFLDRNFINNKIFKQNISLKYLNIAAMAKRNSDPLPVDNTHKDVVLVKSVNENNFLLSSDIDGNPANYYYYLMVFQDTYDPTTLKGDFDHDKQRGIPHIYTGRDRGIVKRASFKKTALPYKREERIAGTNKDYNPIIQLSSLYNVDLETFGNTIFMVGSYFYLVPSGMGSTSLGMPNEERSISNIMGLGGYYFVNKITWSLESGKFNSNITGIHQATGAPNSLANGQTAIVKVPVACTDP